MNDDVDIAHRAFEAIDVSDVADEEAQAVVSRECRVTLHFILFKFVTRENDEPRRFESFEDNLQESLSKRTGAAGDEYRYSVESGHWMVEGVYGCA